VEVFSNVELLEKIGLRVPQVTELVHLLKEKHALKLAEQYPVTIDQAEAIFKQRLS